VANPANTQIGVIQINARTLATDNNFRNRAIRNAILDTNSFEFITFTPTSVAGLPEQAAIGQAFTFQIIGDLTVKDVTRSVTFEVTVTPIDENQIRGSATTTIRHADFGLLIPDVPSVSDVSDEVRLELEFVAYPVA
jgi:polyisoprenoid-binding protein YceI